MAGQFQLVMRTGPNPGKTFALSKNEIIIGRDVEIDISINDAEVSRNHAKLVLTESTYLIEDLGSTNGTYVNEKKTSGQVALNSNDVVRMGDNVTMVFEVIGADPEATKLARGGEPATMPASSAQPQSATPAPAQEQPAPQAPVQQQPAPQAPAQTPAAQPQAAQPTPQAPAAQPPAAPPPPAQNFAGQIPASPSEPVKPSKRRKWMIGCGVVLVLGACALTAFLWYVDANFLWCDVFGQLIPACP